MKTGTIAFLACVWALAFAAGGAWTQGWTYDEPTHLAWSARLLDERVTERASDPRYDSKTPVTLLNVLADRGAARLGARDERTRRFATRLPNVFWLVLLLRAAYVMARRLAGPTGAPLVLLVLALDPNLAAHGSLATVDLPFAAATILTLDHALRFFAEPTRAAAVRLGVALGLAFTIKFSAVLLVVCLFLLPLARRRQWSWTPGRWLSGAALAAVVALLTIDAAYLFAGVGAPLSSAAWRSGLLKPLAAAAPWLRLPLPIDFLTGLDILVDAEAHPPWHSQWNVVLLGQVRPNGVWYYFLVHWLLKTPVLVLAAVAAALWSARRALLTLPAARFLAAALIVHLAYFSLLFRTQVGYRFALMCVPLGAVLAARGFADWSAERLRRWAAAAAAVSALELLPYWGDPLAFTNALVQPKRLAYRYVADSNLDWGQNDARVREEARGTPVDPLEIAPGPNIIGGSLLAGVVQPERFRWLRAHLRPARHRHHTHFVFEVTPEQYAAFLDAERTFASRPIDVESCPTPGAVVQGNVPVRFEGYGDGVLPRVCLHAETTTDLVLAATAGVAVLTPAGLPPKSGRRVLEGESLVFRLTPGPHAFVVGRHKDFEGTWTASGPIALSVGPAPAPAR